MPLDVRTIAMGRVDGQGTPGATATTYQDDDPRLLTLLRTTFELADLERNYRTAFLRYLVRREEGPLHVGYELGRTAVTDGLSLLDLAQVHHDVLLEVLRDSPVEDLSSIATAVVTTMVWCCRPSWHRRTWLSCRSIAATKNALRYWST